MSSIFITREQLSYHHDWEKNKHKVPNDYCEHAYTCKNCGKSYALLMLKFMNKPYVPLLDHNCYHCNHLNPTYYDGYG